MPGEDIRPDSWPSLIAVRFVVGMTALLGNLLILLVVWRTKELRRTKCHVLIGILAGFDVVIGCGSLARGLHAVHAKLNGVSHFSKVSCVLLNMPHAVAMYAGHVVVLCIAGDRLRAVRAPLQYKRHTTYKLQSTLAAVAAATAFSGAAYAFLTAFRMDTAGRTTICTMGSVSGPWAKPIGLYSHATLIILVVLYSLTLFYYYRNRAQLIYSAKAGQDMRVFTGVLLILLKYIVVWCIPEAFVFFTPLNSPRHGILATIEGHLAMLNAATSFIVYLVKSEEMRDAALRLLTRTSCEAYYGRNLSVLSTLAGQKGHAVSSSHSRYF